MKVGEYGAFIGATPKLPLSPCPSPNGRGEIFLMKVGEYGAFIGVAPKLPLSPCPSPNGRGEIFF